MQDNKKNSTLDTRSFAEIYNSLIPREQKDLRDEIISKLKVSRQTVYNWAGGVFKPSYDIITVQIAS